MNSSPDWPPIELSPLPAPTVLCLRGVYYACSPVPGSPGVNGGPPDGWEPPEPDELGDVYRHDGGKWIEIDDDEFFEVEDELWKLIGLRWKAPGDLFPS
jgi:hypothetical protein